MCLYLEQVLVRQVVAWVQFEYEHVIDSSLSPAVCVDAQQEEELDEQEASAVHPHHRPHVLVTEIKRTCRAQAYHLQRMTPCVPCKLFLASNAFLNPSIYTTATAGCGFNQGTGLVCHTAAYQSHK